MSFNVCDEGHVGISWSQTDGPMCPLCSERALAELRDETPTAPPPDPYVMAVLQGLGPIFLQASMNDPKGETKLKMVHLTFGLAQAMRVHAENIAEHGQKATDKLTTILRIQKAAQEAAAGHGPEKMETDKPEAPAEAD